MRETMKELLLLGDIHLENTGGLFITGTGTDVGKTFVTGFLVKKLLELGIDVCYYKAAVSGNERKDGKLVPGDAAFVAKTAGLEENPSELVSFVYEQPLSPHLASRIEGNPVTMDKIREDYKKAAETHDLVVMEGSGGILCPLYMEEKEIWLEDVIKELSLPSLIVADAGLGTINHTILTVEYMKQKGLPVLGIILNRFHPGNIMEEDNRKIIREKTGLPVGVCIDAN